MQIPSTTDVLIVGAGPTGLMLANQLARRGVRVLVVDRNPGPSVRTKALGVHARTLEIYSKLGIVGQALELGTRAIGANMWVNGKRAARIPFGDIGSGLSAYPFLLILGQDDNERLLGDALRAHAVDVQWNTELVELVQKPEHANATLKRSDGSTLQVDAQWVAGCDGPRSTVRERCKIDFVGAPYEHVFFVADTQVSGPMVPGELNLYLWRGGFHIFFPMRATVAGPPQDSGTPPWGAGAAGALGAQSTAVAGPPQDSSAPPWGAGAAGALGAQSAAVAGPPQDSGAPPRGAGAAGALGARSNHWRVVGIVPAEMRGRDDLQFDEVLPDIRHVVGPALSLHACSWFSTYRIHHRRAERFREGRCFLLGDAAHIHSPVGAQGMNTGLQDAYNLAWKLALVTSGKADDRLLDSYALERIPVADRLLKTTDQAFSVVVSDRWLAKLFRTRIANKLVAFAMGRERLRRLAFVTISQIGIRYPDSPLSRMAAGWPDGAPLAGDRFPWLRLKRSPDGSTEDLYAKLDDTRFNLIVIGQAGLTAEPTGLEGLLLTHVVPDDALNDRELARWRLPKPSFFLLRPDGHVGLAGTRLDAAALGDYMRSITSAR